MRRAVVTILVFPMLFFSLIQITIAQDQESQLDFAGGSCINSEIIDTNGTYHSNILTLFSDLRSSTSDQKFFSASVGLGADLVNGYYLCRPDLSFSTCEACVNATINTIDQFCFDRKEAMVWYDECMVRYTNNSVSPTEGNGTDPWDFNYSTFNVSKPEGFPELVNTTMQGLISEAISPDNLQRFFAHHEQKNFTAFEGFYGMVLCRSDLAANACESCLMTALGKIPSCCSNSLSSWTTVMLPNCFLKYDTAPFIFDSP